MQNTDPVESHPNPWRFLVTKKTTHCELITKRELFAAMAMLMLRADDNDTERDIAAAAARQADALIDELAKSTEQKQ